MDIYTRTHTSEHEWTESYKISKTIMEYPFDIDLYFEEHKSLVTTRIPGGRMSMIDNAPGIIVHPYLFIQKTSENLRQYLYCHEIAEMEISNSPISIYFSVINVFHGRPYYKRDIHANRIVYNSLTKRIGETFAKERILAFAEEWLDLRPQEYFPRFDGLDEYIEKTMPFLAC